VKLPFCQKNNVLAPLIYMLFQRRHWHLMPCVSPCIGSLQTDIYILLQIGPKIRTRLWPLCAWLLR